MGLINKPKNHVAGTLAKASDVNANDDTIYALVNGGVTNDNISASAAIAQSKINGLVAALTARVLKAGDEMTGGLKIDMSEPFLRLTGQEASARDWRLVEIAGTAILQRNDGTEAIPVWVTVYQFKFDGAPTEVSDVPRKEYVDAITRGLAIGKVTKTDSNFDTASTSFVDVTGASLAITTLARRVRVTIIGQISNLGGASLPHLGLSLDGVDVEGGAILFSGSSSNNQGFHITYITDLLTAAAHTFILRMKTTSGANCRLIVAAATPLIMWAEELPYAG